MDLSSETLSELLCSVCEDYLSCSPAYLTHSGEPICGHCYDPKTSPPANRMTQYEALARYVRFPCKYRDLGCEATQPFSESLQDKPHELGCEFRQYLCPVVKSGECEWLGKRSALLAHCRENHSNEVVENSCSLTHDISKNSLKNYLLTAFEMLFLLHTKVCVASGKICHAVRLIGDPEKTSKFKYSLKIKRESFEVTRPGTVAPQGCLAIQEDSSIALDINSLIHVLDGFSGTSFIVTVQLTEDEEDENMKCIKCKSKIVPTSKDDDYYWKCLKCNDVIRSCGFRSDGCKFIDEDYKAEKHEAYFCPYQKDCYLGCDHTINDSPDQHYLSMHSDIIHKAGSAFLVTQGWWQKVVLSTDFGLMICEYLFEDTKFKVDILFKVRSNHLKEYNCTIKIFSSDMQNFILTLKPKVSLDECWDWRSEFTKQEISFWDKEFRMMVIITK